MALNTFASHLGEVGLNLKALRSAIRELDGLLNRHVHNNYTSIISSEFDIEPVTKEQYDSAMASISNLIDTWLPAGHGTNIDSFLYETPETSP